MIEIIKFTKKYYALFGIAIMTIIIAVNRQLVANNLGKLVDASIKNRTDVAKGSLLYLLLGICTLTIFTCLYNFLTGWYKNISMHQIRLKTIKIVQELPLQKISNYSSGDLVSRMNNDLSFVEKMYEKVIPDTLLKLLTGLIAAMYGFFINWKITILIMGLSLIVSIITYFASKPLERKQGELQRTRGEISNTLQDTLNGYTEIKTFSAYDVIMGRFNNLIYKRVLEAINIAKKECIIGSLEVSASIALQIGTVFLGLIFVFRKEMTIGELIIFQQIQEAIRKIFNIQYVEIIKAEAVFKRIFELWREEIEILDGEIKIGDNNAPVVALDKVDFTFEGMERKFINSLTLKINKNETVALVGESGCGKSTIAKLICGLYVPDSGTISFMGYDYKKWDKRVLRNNISLVEQNNYIFPGTIFENIACGVYGYENTRALDSIEGIVEKSAKAAALTDFISSLSKGYSSEVGEWGERLSGGQRQRIAIARAFAKPSGLLILDEPTSSLDVETELEIQKSLEKLMKGRTTLIVAHRLSTIKNADKILVIDKGRIVEEGKHGELIRRKGFYYRLYREQTEIDVEVI